MDDLIRNRNAKLAAFQQEIDTLKDTLSNHIKEKESLSKTLTVFKTESKEKESKYIDSEIILEKQNKELENIICKMYRSMQAMHMLTKPQVFYDDTHKQALGYQNPFNLKKAQRIKPTLYDGSVIAKVHAVIYVIDDEETLILKEESRSKMLDKQNDLHTPVRIEAPSELPKRTTSDAITACAWGFEHTKACFVTEIIPFLKVLEDTFNAFDKTILDEITEVQTIFNQMEAVVDQCSVDKNTFEIQIKQLSIDNDQLLKQIMSQEIVHIAVNSVDILIVNKSCVDECNKCLELETELLKKKILIEKDVYDKLLKTQSQEKDTVIRKLKDEIKSLSGKDSVKNVKKDIDEIKTINIELEHKDDVDINTLTMEQYLAWVKDGIRPGVVKPKIGNDVEFEINSNFMRELRRKLFKGTDDEDANEHVRKVLEIADLLYFPGDTHDAVMLRVFLITLKGPALRWINRLSAGYNGLLFKCSHHDLNYQQKVHIFYTGLNIPTRRVLNSIGFIPLMTPTQALISIQVMAEHSHNWYDEATTREQINDSLNNIETKKPKENIHAIQASFMNCEGAHLTMEYPLEKEDKAVEQSKYMRSLEETIIKFYENSISKQATDNEWIRNSSKTRTQT
ncbi:hypothetical protein Tco_0975755 [Tanacetum coccineum]|uniref:Retrotransposon gag domain-containing protein n=1 Tax=Tanacetum coccineum TaxID=301880 RepID=A0ABQ5EFL1_9ASTR